MSDGDAIPTNTILSQRAGVDLSPPVAPVLSLPAPVLDPPKYPAIPDPGPDLVGLQTTVRALTEAVRVLTGQVGAAGAGRALTVADAASILGSTPRDVKKAIVDKWSILDKAADDVARLSRADANAILAELQRGYTQAAAGVTSSADEIAAFISGGRYALAASAVVNGKVNTLTTRVDNNTAAITDTNYTRADKFSALSGHITTVTASTDANTAAITDSNYTRTDKFSALSARITTVTAHTDDNTAAINDTNYTRSDKFGALSTRVSSTLAIAGRERTFVQATAPTIGGDGNYTAPPNVVGLPAVIGDLWIDTTNGNLIKSWNGTAWVASDDTRIGLTVASITDTNYARADKFNAMTGRISTAQSTADDAQSWITDTNYTRADKFHAVAGRLNTVEAQSGSDHSAITDTDYTRVDKFQALAGRISTVEVLSGDATAGGYYRLTGVATTLGAAAEFAVQVTASQGTGYASSGLRLQVLSNGSSRVMINTGQFIVENGDSIFSISGGNLYFSGLITSANLVTGAVTAASVSTNKIILNGSNIDDLLVNTNHLVDNSVSNVTTTSVSGSNIFWNGSAHNIGTMPLTIVSGKVFVLMIIDIDSGVIASNVDTPANYDLSIQLQLSGTAVINGLIAAGIQDSLHANLTTGNVTCRVRIHGSYAFSTIINTGAGNYNLNAYATGANVGAGPVGSTVSLIAIELKK